MMIEGWSNLTFGQFTGSPPVGDGPGMTIEVSGRSITNDLASLAITHEWSAYPGQPGPYSGSVTISSVSERNRWTTYSLVLNQPESAVSGSDPLPQTLRLSDFSTANLDISVAGLPTTQDTRGTIDTLVEVPVPEPTLTTSLCLVAIGLVASRTRTRLRESK
jgi:hypothetical protein